ncbi:MAG: proteasome assembly chaperone family protein [Candidatus Lokiarchaeota archaeon]|nr:proteasome assembly chaperone family protein [Candidatus Lokiarchaeota archaeon]
MNESDRVENNNEVNIVIDESKNIKTLIIGFPDVGLVGLISSMHIIETLDMKEFGYVESDMLPPLVVLHNGIFQSPVRFYYKDSIAVLVSEIPVSANLANALSKKIMEIIVDKNIEKTIVLYGIPSPNRMNIDNPAIFSNGTNPKTLKMIKDNDLKYIDTGVISGIQAPIIWESQKKQLSTIAIGAEAFLQYPDPAAAANAVEVLNKLTGLNIDVKLLNEKAEDLRVKLRDTMARTQEQIRSEEGGMRQVDLPAMFG